MKGNTRKHTLFVSMVAAVVISLASGAVADDKKYDLNIKQQAIGLALVELGAATGVQMMVPQNLGTSAQFAGLKGQYTLAEALDSLLAGTDMAYSFSADNMVVIKQGQGGGRAVGGDKSSEAKPLALEEVIVTAQKREQNVQDVPVAITALSAEHMEQRGIVSPEDLQFSVPGLVLGETTLGTAQVTIRGVGSENIRTGGDPGVPLHIDGHYIQFSSYVLQDLFDIERMEVQRGPQGTLYGRNAVGGNINIITNRPSEEFESSVSMDLGNYNKRRIQGMISGPLADGLRGRIVVSREKRDGFVENISTGEDFLDSDYTAIRGSLEYDLTENIQLSFSGYHYKDNSISFVNRIVGPYPDTGFYALTSIPYTNISAIDPGKIRSNVDHKAKEKTKGISFDVNWDLGNVTFKSLTAYNDAKREILQDLDGLDLPSRALAPGETGLELPLREQFSEMSNETFTQEFQLLSNNDSDLKWIGGLFYYQEDGVDIFQITVPSTPILFSNAPNRLEATSVAVFGQLDYALSEKWALVGGLRYTHDEKEMLRTLFFTMDGTTPAFGLASLFDVNGKLDDSWQAVTGTLGVNYSPSQDTLLYASYSRGYKAGGFTTGVAEPSYDPEFLDAYEAGMKGQFFNDRLQLNISAYYYEYKDKTESKIDVAPGQTTVGTIIFTNAGAATVSGVELETQAYLTDSLLIDSSISYQKAEYDEFNSQDPQFPMLGVQDLSGNTLTRSPELKFHLGMQYEWLLARDLGSLVARVDYSWVDEQYFRAFNLETDKGDSYHRTNARLRWKSVSTHWLVELYGLNLENDYILSNLSVASPDLGFAHYGSYLSPRTYGLKVNYHF